MAVVLVASLLKPLDDPRMAEKIAHSLSPHFQVHIAGSWPVDAPFPQSTHIHYHALGPYARGAAARLRCLARLLRLACALRPAVIIFNSPECLLPLALLKALFPCRLVYDVLENYALNLRAQAVYGWPVKHLLAGAVRALEWCSRLWIAQYWLAEKTYQTETKFHRGKSLVLENKFVRPPAPWQPRPCPVRLPAHRPWRLLHTGTVSRHYGSHLAIGLLRALQAAGLPCTLHLLGHCSDPAYRAELETLAQATEGLHLELSAEPVPHHLLLAAAARADLALLCYLPNPSTAQCIPARLYEYAAHALPVLVPAHNALWQQICRQWGAGLGINYQQPELAPLLAQLAQQCFYPEGPPAEAFWEEEAEKMRQALLEFTVS